MKYLISERQYKSLVEYFDPIYFVKKKLSQKPKQIKNPEYIKYEDKFQSLVNMIFRFVTADKMLKHLKGFKVSKVTPSYSDGGQRWSVLLEPIVDEYFNWKENPTFMEQLEKFVEKFKEVSKVVSSPYDEDNLPQNVEFSFWLH